MTASVGATGSRRRLATGSRQRVRGGVARFVGLGRRANDPFQLPLAGGARASTLTPDASRVTQITENVTEPPLPHCWELQREAGVLIGEVARRWRAHASTPWKRVAEQADEATAAALDAARASEADALTAAEAATEKDVAVVARERAAGEVEGLRAEMEQLRG